MGCTSDDLDRLTATVGNSGIGISTLRYDSLGNIEYYQSKGKALSYQYDSNFKLTKVTNSNGSVVRDFSQGYDDRGNVTNNGTMTFGYNRANQMVTAGNYSYVYNSDGKRVKSVDSQGTQYSFYSKSGRLLQLLFTERNNSATNYIYLGQKLIAKQMDATSPLLTPSSTPSSSDSRQHYRPFGETIEAPKNDIGYTGHKFDADLGLSYMQARYYDPLIGRFYIPVALETAALLAALPMTLGIVMIRLVQLNTWARVMGSMALITMFMRIITLLSRLTLMEEVLL